MAVFVHGFLGTNTMWDSVVSHGDTLCGLPGHDTDVQPELFIGNSIENYDDIIDSFAKKQKGEASIFVAYSMGARLVLSLAIKYPELVKGLILIGVNPGIVEKQEREKRKLWEQELCGIISESGLELFVKRWEEMTLFESQKNLPQKIKQNQKVSRLSHQPEQIIKALEFMGTGVMPHEWNNLNKLSIPVVYLAGEFDYKFVELAQKAKKETPVSRLEIVQGCGHNTVIENPNATKEQINRAAKWIESRK